MKLKIKFIVTKHKDTSYPLVKKSKAFDYNAVLLLNGRLRLFYIVK